MYDLFVADLVRSGVFTKPTKGKDGSTFFSITTGTGSKVKAIVVSPSSRSVWLSEVLGNLVLPDSSMGVCDRVVDVLSSSQVTNLILLEDSKGTFAPTLVKPYGLHFISCTYSDVYASNSGYLIVFKGSFDYGSIATALLSIASGEWLSLSLKV